MLMQTLLFAANAMIAITMVHEKAGIVRYIALFNAFAAGISFSAIVFVGG